MQNSVRLVVGVALLAAAAFPSIAKAQGAPAIQVVGGTSITLGGGVQWLALPDMNFTFNRNLF
jgi:predicted phage tail protein